MYLGRANILLFFSILSSSYAKITCSGLPLAKQLDCSKLLDTSLGNNELAPVKNGYATIASGTCAITTKLINNKQRITKDYLARRGNIIYSSCDSPQTSGIIDAESGFNRVCLLAERRYAYIYYLCYYSF